MAALECNGTPTSFNNTSGQENGEALPEEKSLSIDYSEDLWLANSEDSSGPYAGQRGKTTAHEISSSHTQPALVSYSTSSISHHVSGDVLEQSSAGSPYTTVSQQHWGDISSQGGDDGSNVLQPNTPTFINGAVEQNGMEFHAGSGDEKDFAQMVPAGTYVEASDANNKTFAALMPAASLDSNGEEMQTGFTTMLNAAGQQQMVFYGSGEDVSATDHSSHILSQHQLEQYAHQSNQMVGVDSQDGSTVSGEDGPGEGNLYVAMEGAENQVTQSGVTVEQYAVLSPAVLGNQVQDDSKIDGTGNHQNISTLSYIQTNSYPQEQGNFTAFNHSVANANVNEISQQDDSTQVEGQEEYDQDEEENSNQQGGSEIAYQGQEQYQEMEGVEEEQGDANAQSKNFVCQTCNKSFATGRYLKYHRKHHCKRAGSYEGKSEQEDTPGFDVKRFTCNICQRPFRVLKCMKVHKKKKHGILKDFTCPGCAVTFPTVEQLTDHPCEQKSPIPSQEPTIMASPLTPPSAALFLSQRKKKKHRLTKPACDICGKVFGDRISLDIHRVKHIEEEFYPCDMCPLDLHAEDSTHLAVHFRIKFFTDDNQHILEDQKAAAEALQQPPTPSSSTVYSNPSSIIATAAACTNIINPDGSTTYIDENGEEYSTIKLEDGSVGLARATAMAQQPYTAVNIKTNQSPAASTDEGSSGTPQRVHLPNRKPYICDICNKSFAEPAKLEIHYKSNHVEDRPFHCEVCVKSFYTKWKLQRHMLSHLEQKPHSCPACSKSFVERGKLEAHYRTHLGTKPYKCEYCGKAFTVKSQLTIHVRRIHSLDQPFGCEVCGKAFLWRSGLEKHMRKHTREKPYHCSYCSVKYSQKSNLVSHLSKVHNHEYTEPPDQPQHQIPKQNNQQVQQLQQQQQQEQELLQQEDLKQEADDVKVFGVPEGEQADQVEEGFKQEDAEQHMTE